jgi:hypothetical protein
MYRLRQNIIFFEPILDSWDLEFGAATMRVGSVKLTAESKTAVGLLAVLRSIFMSVLNVILKINSLKIFHTFGIKD